MTVPPYARGYEDFPGRVGRTVAESTPAWPEPVRPPAGAPNVIVVLLDDMGYSDIGPFGSEVPTPALQRLADEGFSFTNYHTTPVCSPARAAVLTGLNPHRAGFATVANSDPGFPGMRLELAEDVTTLAEVLHGQGYATAAVGKWHLTRDSLNHEGADKAAWPVQRGFDHYYGSLEGLNSFFHPNQIVRDNTVIQHEQTPEGYYLTDDYTDEAVNFIKGTRASSDRPFFLYFAHTAMHGPLGAKTEDIDRHRGRYADGWDALRRARYARQLELGIIPEGTDLPEAVGRLGREVTDWESLDAETRDLYAKYQEVYAAMVDSVDQSLGRIIDLLDTLGEKDNTIIVFTSDNGGSAEGGPEGTRSYFSRFAHVPGLPADWTADVDRDPSLIGGPRSMAHYPEGWGMASNTPFRFYKGQTFAGGVRVPLLLSWPAGLGTGGSAREGLRHQYQYVTDLTPTILDLVGVPHPSTTGGTRHGRPVKDIDGVSFAPVLRDAAHPSTRPEQYAEFGGNRGLYRDGWKILTNHRFGTPFDDAEWQLFNVTEDPTEIHDLAAEYPELVRDMAARWERLAWENTVFPLNDHSDARAGLRRASDVELEQPVTLWPGTPKLERYRSSRLTQLRSFDVVIDVEIGEGDAGVLVSHGDQGGGYVVWVDSGADGADGADGATVHLAVNEYGDLHEVAVPVGPGRQIVRVHSAALPQFRTTWTVTVGEASAQIEDVWALLGMAPFSGIDVGVNRGGPVHWDNYVAHGSWRYTGDLHTVRYEPGERAPYSPDVLAELARDAAEVFD
ncbi:arylsulfatase [Corynebacterium terpenotabidum]|uniref:Arylsulfatase n=1 Tax=Corynebacterium terpenotabidum Y-11 TaxID=1200352 RepID=S4XAM4_9CORY|nr:arylsulfatase [Corynebacterium terpenotabidum]AGP29681.1 arylsulfatase [Corynebacterium terpenotabidum Y-11]